MSTMDELDSKQKSERVQSDKTRLSENLRKRLTELEKAAKDKDISPRLISALRTLAHIEEAVDGGKIRPTFEARDAWKLVDQNASAESVVAKTVKRDLKNLVLVGKIFLIGETCPTCGHKTRELLFSLQSFEPHKEQYDFTQ